MRKFFKNCAYWSLHFICYAGLILTIGSVVGAILFIVFGKSFTDYTLLNLIKKGLSIGFRYAGVWAVGLGIVLCFVKGGRKGKGMHG